MHRPASRKSRTGVIIDLAFFFSCAVLREVMPLPHSSCTVLGLGPPEGIALLQAQFVRSQVCLLVTVTRNILEAAFLGC